MTLSQIMALALRQLDEDPEDISEYDDLFKVYANQAYRIATEDYLRPREERRLRSDENGDIALCESSIRRVVGMKRVIAEGERWQRMATIELSADGRAIHTPFAQAEFIAVCEVVYPEMTQETDIPRIPASAHDAIADYICWRHLSNGNLAKQSRAQAYMQRFYQAMQRLRPQGMGSVTGYRNLYAVTEAGYAR